MKHAGLPSPLRTAFLIKDVLLHAIDLRNAQDNEAGRYLKRRGFLPFPAPISSRRLFYHHCLPYMAGQGSFPSLVGLATSFEDEARAIQITYLTAGGDRLAPVKSPRLYFGRHGGMILPLSHGNTGRPLYAPHARLIEGGATLPAHDILPNAKQAMRFLMGSAEVFAKLVRFPGATVPAQHPVHSAFGEMKDEIANGMRDAVTFTVSKGND